MQSILTGCPFSRTAVSRVVLMLVVGWAGMAKPANAWQSMSGYSGRSSLSRARRMMQAQRTAAINQLKQELAAAEAVYLQAQTAGATATSQVQTAMSRLEHARGIVDADQADAREATKRTHAAEDRILEAQAANSPHGLKSQAVRNQQIELDRQMHELLGLPRTNGDASESEQTRQSEYLHLSPTQKSQLKSSAEYSQANERLGELSDELKELQKELYAADPEWTSATEALKAAHQKKSEDDKELRRASTENVQARAALQNVATVSNQAQAAIVQTGGQLQQLGVNPATVSPAKKK